MTPASALEFLEMALLTESRNTRARHRLTVDELRGTYVSDEWVLRMLAAEGSEECSPSAPPALACDGVDSLLEDARWARLTDLLSLRRFERAVLLLALASEVDGKYERVFGYLNNDLTRRLPTRDLAIRLFRLFEGDEARCREMLADGSPLFRNGLLHIVSTGSESTSWLGSGIQIDPAVSHALLGAGESGIHLPFAVQWSDAAVNISDSQLSENVQHALQRLACVEVLRRGDDGEPLLVFSGLEASAHLAAASALANARGVSLLRIDARTLPDPGERFAALLAAATLHQLLFGSVLFLDGIDVIFGPDRRHSGVLQLIADAVRDGFGPVVVGCEPECRHDLFSVGNGLGSGRLRTVLLQFALPTVEMRKRVWGAEGERRGVLLGESAVESLSTRFALTVEQIRAAISRAADEVTLTDASVEDAVFEAARDQTRAGISALAMRSSTPHDWSDLVLPDVTARQLREVASAIRHRDVVFEHWGFGQRIARGKGLTVLFSGASGTGKTMAAAVIAKELCVDLYTLDLSTVVSKYIGETEKNLDRVFRAAHNSNAILFFDEADALFGKRSEVKDAHDRYANIEVAYLLQRMEQHEGAVILATNLGRNIDPAFARRVHYAVDFPLPSESHRERLWRGMFPAQAPLAADVDFPFFARHFETAGGDIRNVALDAAFLAAQNGRVVTMEHLVNAMARQLRKQGRTPSATDFKHHFALIARD